MLIPPLQSPSVNPGGSQGVHPRPQAALPSFFTDKAAGTYQETRLVSAVCPVLAISFFLIGLGIGAVCALRTQVGGEPQVSPVSP